METLYILADDSGSGGLASQMRRAGFRCEVVETAQQIPVNAARRGAVSVLCGALGDLLECHHPYLVPVYYCDGELSVDAMLQALGNGDNSLTAQRLAPLVATHESHSPACGVRLS